MALDSLELEPQNPSALYTATFHHLSAYLSRLTLYSLSSSFFFLDATRRDLCRDLYMLFELFLPSFFRFFAFWADVVVDIWGYTHSPCVGYGHLLLLPLACKRGWTEKIARQSECYSFICLAPARRRTVDRQKNKILFFFSFYFLAELMRSDM